ncbi:calmodulin [Pseudonocardiaceae bacterium YIM PH 21723]|nr:calmodulin [Pseudonocardiaceae bacterium YIM PH 21723]
MRLLSAVLAVLMAVALGGANASAEAATARFVFTDASKAEFVIELTDAKSIDHARRLLSGQDKDRQHVNGLIVKQTAPYNPRWGYHLTPASISFFDAATEVCDATIVYTQEHLAEAGGAFLPGLRWCPWSSKLVREI